MLGELGLLLVSYEALFGLQGGLGLHKDIKTFCSCNLSSCFSANNNSELVENVLLLLLKHFEFRLELNEGSHCESLPNTGQEPRDEGYE